MSHPLGELSPPTSIEGIQFIGHQGRLDPWAIPTTIGVVRPPSCAQSAFGEDWTGRNVCSDRLPSNGDAFLHRLHPAHLQNILRPWVDPYFAGSALGLVFFGHPICCSDMKSLEPRKGGLRENPSLAAVEEDGLDDSLVETCGHKLRDILTSKNLSHSSPSRTGFP
jgi:hypothetical protein